MVDTERAKMAAVSCGISHVSAVSTPLRWILKTRHKKLVTLVESYASAVSLLESGEERYKKKKKKRSTTTTPARSLSRFAQTYRLL